MATPNTASQSDFPAGASSENAEGEFQPTLSTPPVVETEFAELADGALVEMIEDPEDSAKTLLAVYKGGEVQYANRVQSEDRVLVPIPRNQHIIQHVRLPRGVKACESAASLIKEIWSLFCRCLDVEDECSFLLAFFVLSTWFIDQIPVAPYVAFVGLPGSGKSTALRLLRLLCRRAFLTADITSAAFYRACNRLTPTVLIDETATAGETRTLFHLLRTGTTRDVVAFRKQESFSVFGAKAVSWIEPPNDAALNSRCLLIPLHETRRADLKRPCDPEIVQAADELQRKLLYLRFKNYKKLNLSSIEGDEQLQPRTRDLYQALALPTGGDTTACKFLLSLLKIQQISNREPLTLSQSAVLRYLFFAMHKLAEKGNYAVFNLTNGVNSVLKADGESFRLSPRKVGSVLSSLGFTRRTRTNHGYTVSLDLKTQERVHELIATYGADSNRYLPSELESAQCELCKARHGAKGVPTSRTKQTASQPTENKKNSKIGQ